MTADIRDIERRTVRSWFEDGIWELGFGFFSLWLGIYFAGQAAAPARSTLKFVLDAGFLIWFLLGGWLVKTGVRLLKRLLTYRRSGFVSYKQTERGRRALRAGLGGALAGLIGAGLAFFLARGPSRLNAVPAVTGLVFVIVLLLLSYRTGSFRLVFVAAFAAAAGTGLALSAWPESVCLAVFYGLVAAALFVSGGLTLAGYLRRNPVHEVDPS